MTGTLCFSSMTAFVRLVRTDLPDGSGGQDITLVPGEQFSAAVVRQRTETGRAGDREEGKDEVLLYTESGVMLPFSGLVRRCSDGAVFRILSDGDAGGVPAGAECSPALALRVVRAVRYGDGER